MGKSTAVNDRSNFTYLQGDLCFKAVEPAFLHFYQLPLMKYSTSIFNPAKKPIGQSKEVKHKWRRPKYFDMSFSVIFSCYGKSLISGRKPER